MDYLAYELYTHKNQGSIYLTELSDSRTILY